MMNESDTPVTINTDAAGWRVLTTEQTLPRPRPEVFAFFADAGNLNQITPPWVHFKIVTPGPIAMRAGTLIDYTIRVRGVPVRWRTRISEWNPPFRFADEQIRGPYAAWIHEHEFEEVADGHGGTLMRDRVRYRMPLAWVPGAGLVDRLLVGPDLRRIFAFRRAVMSTLFGRMVM